MVWREFRSVESWDIQVEPTTTNEDRDAYERLFVSLTECLDVSLPKGKNVRRSRSSIEGYLNE